MVKIFRNAIFDNIHISSNAQKVSILFSIPPKRVILLQVREEIKHDDGRKSLQKKKEKKKKNASSTQPIRTDVSLTLKMERA